MTYFIEFHTPRGIFTSIPQTFADTEKLIEAFERCLYGGGVAAMRVPRLDGGKICLTTDMIRQTILVTREAE